MNTQNKNWENDGDNKDFRKNRLSNLNHIDSKEVNLQ